MPSKSSGSRKLVTRSETRRNLKRIAAASQASQAKIAVRASSRLKKKEIIRNRSPFFPGTTLVGHPPVLKRRVYLPDDVVIIIFSLYLRSMETSHLEHTYFWPGLRATPFFLASVCFSWSRIVRNTPGLWKHLDLHLAPTRYKRQCTLLRQWLENTSGCELSVSVLTHVHNQGYWGAHLPQEIYDIVESRAPQITELSIPGFPDYASAKMTGFQNLRHLRVECGQYLFPWADAEEPTLEIDAPSLVRLQTYGVDTKLIRIVDDQGDAAPLHGLRALSTQIITAHLTYEALRSRELQHNQLSTLTHLDISSLDNEPMDFQAMANDAPRVQFPNLIYLRCNSFVHILTQIAFAPLLATLVCYIPLLGNPEPELLSNALDFLLYAGCRRLEAFIISSPDQLFNVYEDDLLALLWFNPHLRDVSIMGAAYDEQEEERYISDALITTLRLIPPPVAMLDLEPDTKPPPGLMVSKLRSFTYCGPINTNKFTSFNVWHTLKKRFEVYPSIHTTPCPLEVLRIISTSPIADNIDDGKDTHELIDDLHKAYPHFKAYVIYGTSKHQMYDVEKVSAEAMSSEVRYLSYCDHPHGVGLDEPFDGDFFQLRYVMSPEERWFRRYEY